MVFPKSTEYVESIYNISTLIHKNAIEKKDKRFFAISIIINNYFKKIVKDGNLENVEFAKNDCINLIPLFEYVSINNIEFYDFNTIKMEDVDVNNEADLERFVLSHIYYITQK